MKTTTGCIYAYHPNGNRRERTIVRDISRSGFGAYRRIRGPGKLAVPYNFAYPEHMHRASRREIQAFVQQMPL